MPPIEKMPVWEAHDSGGYVLASRDPFTGHIESLEVLTVTHELGDPEDAVPVVVISTRHMSQHHAIPMLQVSIPAMCGHFKCGGSIAELGLN
jgi:hypothetical protein